MISSALPTLADQARCAGHPKSAEFEAMLRQTRPLLYRPEYGDVMHSQIAQHKRRRRRLRQPKRAQNISESYQIRVPIYYKQ